MSKRIYLECTENGASKFWNVQTQGSTMTVQYGKIGASGAKTEYNFSNETQAEEQAEKEAGKKLKKGYVCPDQSKWPQMGETKSEAKSGTTPNDNKAPQYMKDAKPGKWILMSVETYRKNYGEEPKRHSNIAVNDNFILLVNTGDAVFTGDFITDLDVSSFGTIENPEKIPFFDEKGHINPSYDTIMYVKGDMLVGRDFIDDLWQLRSGLSFVFEGNIKARNLICSDGYFEVKKDVVVEQVFMAEGNDGSFHCDGSITAPMITYDDRDIYAMKGMNSILELNYWELVEQRIFSPSLTKQIKETLKEDYDEDEIEEIMEQEWPYVVSCEIEDFLKKGKPIFNLKKFEAVIKEAKE